MKKSIENAKSVLWGAICGDVIGSAYEFRPTKDYRFKLFTNRSRFTDDTVCTIAVADALMNHKPMAETLQRWCRRYNRAGYGPMFYRWIASTKQIPYGSYGNGSAMRVSACGALAESLDMALDLAKESAECTHNHPEGIRGAQATAIAIYLALQVSDTGEHLPKEQIRDEIERRFGYDLHRDYEDIKAGYKFDVTCQGSVPEAIISFLNADDYESTVRHAVALGGDADTQAAIAGGIAAAYYDRPPMKILTEVCNRLPDDMLDVIEEFESKFYSQ